MPCTIAPMRPSDMDGKAYVHWKAWQETYSGLVDADYLAGMTLEKCRDIARRWPNDILVAKDGETVVGFIGYGKYRDDSLTDCGEIYSLYLLRAYQGQGIGGALMRAALEKLAIFPRVALWVLRGNDHAIGFYHACGFYLDGTQATLAMGTPRIELRMLLDKGARR